MKSGAKPFAKHSTFKTRISDGDVRPTNDDVGRFDSVYEEAFTRRQQTGRKTQFRSFNKFVSRPPRKHRNFGSFENQEYLAKERADLQHAGWSRT